jgi:hypothetical protein
MEKTGKFVAVSGDVLRKISSGEEFVLPTVANILTCKPEVLGENGVPGFEEFVLPKAPTTAERAKRLSFEPTKSMGERIKEFDTGTNLSKLCARKEMREMQDLYPNLPSESKPGKEPASDGLLKQKNNLIERIKKLDEEIERLKKENEDLKFKVARGDDLNKYLNEITLSLEREALRFRETIAALINDNEEFKLYKQILCKMHPGLVESIENIIKQKD